MSPRRSSQATKTTQWPPELRADCSQCFALCCAAFRFDKSDYFQDDKPGGHPCQYLNDDFSCGIHGDLIDKGYLGCAVFDCHGAGQQVSHATFGGRDWRTNPDITDQVFAVFPIMCGLYELLCYLVEARLNPECKGMFDMIDSAIARVERLAFAPVSDILGPDTKDIQQEVEPVLHIVSTLIRDERDDRDEDLMGADLAGKDLSRLDFTRKNLRGATLIGADLSNATLCRTDLLGADMRNANVAGADLSESIFLTQMQLNSTRGDANTLIPERLERPYQWKK